MPWASHALSGHLLNLTEFTQRFVGGFVWVNLAPSYLRFAKKASSDLLHAAPSSRLSFGLLDHAPVEACSALFDSLVRQSDLATMFEFLVNATVAESHASQSGNKADPGD